MIQALGPREVWVFEPVALCSLRLFQLSFYLSFSTHTEACNYGSSLRTELLPHVHVSLRMHCEQDLINEHIFAVHASMFDLGPPEVTESFKF